MQTPGGGGGGGGRIEGRGGGGRGEGKEKHHATWHPGKELTEEKTEVSIVQSGDMSTECE